MVHPLQFGVPGGVELLVIGIVYVAFAFLYLLIPLLIVFYLRAISHHLAELVEVSRERA